MRSLTVCLLFVTTLFVSVSGQTNEDNRCRCICPNLAEALSRKGGKDLMIYVGNIPPNVCNCFGLVLPRIADVIQGRQLEEYCPRCDCKYETRNTIIIKFVVLFVLFVVIVLLLYSSVVLCLYSTAQRLRERKANLEEVETLLDSHIMRNRHFRDPELTSDDSDCEVTDDIQGVPENETAV